MLQGLTMRGDDPRLQLGAWPNPHNLLSICMNVYGGIDYRFGVSAMLGQA